MRKLRIALLVLVLLLAFTGVVQAQGNNEGKLVVGGTYTLQANDDLFGDLVVLGGTADLETDSTVHGNVILLGGAVTVAGNVTRDIAVFGGSVRLTSTALVQGQLSTFGGSVDRASGARIEGGVTEGPGWRWEWGEAPFIPTMPWWGGSQPTWSAWNIVQQIAQGLLTVLGLMALGVLVVLLLPEQTEQVVQVVHTNAGISIGVGILSLIVIPILMVLLVITCIGPVILAFATGIALLFGWIAVGLLFGRLILQGLHATETSTLVAVILGVGLLALLSEIPCIGWLLALVVAALGLGAVILTRFGTTTYPWPAKATEAAPGEGTESHGTE